MTNREGNDKSNCCIVCREDGRIDDEEEYVSIPKVIIIEATDEVIDMNVMEDEGNLPLDCKKCGGSFSNEMELKRHIRNVHPVKKMRCSFCDKKISRRLLKKHVRDAHGFILSLDNESEASEYKSEEVRSEVVTSSVDPGEDQCGILLDSSEVDITNLHPDTKITCSFCDKRIPMRSLRKHLKKMHEFMLTLESESDEGENKSAEVSSEVVTSSVGLGEDQELMDSSEVDINDLHPETKIMCSFCDKRIPMRLLKKHVKRAHGFILTLENESDEGENKMEEVTSEVMPSVDLEGNQSRILLDSSEVDITDPETKITCSFCDKEVPMRLLKKHVKKAHGFTLTLVNQSEESENNLEELISEMMPSVDLEGNQSRILLDSSEVDIRDPETKITCSFCDKEIPMRLLKKHVKKAHGLTLTLVNEFEESENNLKEVRSGGKSSSVDSKAIQELLDPSEVDMRNVHPGKKIKCSFCDKKVPMRLLKKHVKKAHGFILTLENESDEGENKLEEVGLEMKPIMDSGGDQMMLDSSEVDFRNLHPETKITCLFCDKRIRMRLLKRHVKRAHGFILTFENESEGTENKSEEVRSEVMTSVDSGGDQMMLDSSEVDITDLYSENKITCSFCGERILMTLIEKHVNDEHAFIPSLENESEETENKSEEVISEVMPSVDSEEEEIMLDSSEVNFRNLHPETKITCSFCDERIPMALIKKHVKDEHDFILSLPNESEETENKSEEVRSEVVTSEVMTSEVMPSVDLGEDQILLDPSEVDITDLHPEKITCSFGDESIPMALIKKHVKDEHSFILSLENEFEETENKSEEVRSEVVTLEVMTSEVVPLMDSGEDQILLDSSEVDITDLHPENEITFSFCEESIPMTLIKKHVEDEHDFILSLENESEENENESEEVRSEVVTLEVMPSVDSGEDQILLDPSEVDITDLHLENKITFSFCDESIPMTLIKKHVKDEHGFILTLENESEEIENKSEEVRSEVVTSEVITLVDSGEDQILLDPSEVDITDLHPENESTFSFCEERIPFTLIKKPVEDEHDFTLSLEIESEETENKSEEVRSEVVTSEVMSSPVDSGGDQELLNPCEVLCNVEIRETGSGEEKNVNSKLQGVECKMCNHRYSNELNLKKHMYNVHKMVRVKCQVCDKEVNKKSLDRHMKSVHSARVDVRRERKSVPDEQKLQCVLCNKKCVNSTSLQNHVKNIHEAEQLKCTQCDFQGIRKHMEKHMKKYHNDEVYQCPNCQKILKSKSTLKEHMWIHTDHRRFICDICGMRFKRTSNYHGHLKSHQEKKFQCQLCGNFFLRKRYLAVHEQTIHNYYGDRAPPQEQGYQCEVCGVKLKWKNNLLAHMRIHTGERPYKCKICGDDFTCHGSLRTHMTRHAICPEPDEESNIFIQQSYFDSRAESSLPFFAIPGDSLMQFI